MAERKQVNKYYPPDFDPSKHHSLNQYHGTHALRERARKLDQGILIIRFEMPYNIWCEGCGNHIGMGVRYNSEKTRVGAYYSTPIYKFNMKCHLCPNRIIMQTDPQNLDYIILSGARRQEKRWDALANEQIQAEEKKEHARMEQDSMYKLERVIEDEGKKMAFKPNMERLIEIQSSFWEDDFAQNKKMRDTLRKAKKEDIAKTKEKEGLKDKFALSIPIVDKLKKDDYLAKMILQNSRKDCTENQRDKRKSIQSRDILPTTKPKTKLSKNSKALLNAIKTSSKKHRPTTAGSSSATKISCKISINI